MLDLKFIRENVELVKKNCQDRRVIVDLDRLVVLDDERREMMQQIEVLRAERNQKSTSKPSEEEMARLKSVGDVISQKEQELEKVQEKLVALWMQIPNLTHPQTPIGSEEDFKTVFESPKPTFPFETKDHETLMNNLNVIDFERGAKVAGAKFYFTKGDLVRLNFALLQYGMDVLATYGYELVETPDLAKTEILTGTGYNPRGDAQDQIYTIENTDLSLIATAEITMGGYHQDEVLDLSKGPKKYAAISHCFRKEAGAYGRTSKGLYRVHQFTKLEMFIYCKPEESEAMHQELLSIEREICDGLEIPYRVIDIASSDLGGPAYRKYDIEAWMTMLDNWGEITSTSNCTDYQARRLKIRYKDEEGKTQLVHTLNGTAVVLSRFPIALFENHQQADGSIAIPKVLQKYLGKEFIGK
ncbi:MAG: serine--tRNA ligase [Patescibacteria group bacterium]